MTVMEVVKKFIFKTIFEGEDNAAEGFVFDRELNFGNRISIDPGHNWGIDSIFQMSVAQDKKHKIFISMPLWSGGIIERIDLKKQTWIVHN
jgi:hypothetical protein